MGSGIGSGGIIGAAAFAGWVTGSTGLESGPQARGFKLSASSRDTVSISDEARELNARNFALGDADSQPSGETGGEGEIAAGRNKSQATGQAAEETEDDPNLAQDIAKRIREVQRQLQDAQQRLALAQQKEKSANVQAGATPGAEAPAVAGADGEGQNAAAGEAGAEGAAPSSAGASSGAAAAMGEEDAASIQSQISMLTSKLMTLLQQQMSQNKGGGGGEALGSAGIGGGAGLSGGQGERIEVNA